MTKRLRRFGRDTQGATAVEFALAAGAFFTLMLGVIEYGLIMYTKVAIESATQSGARTVGVSVGSIPIAGCSDRVCTIRETIRRKTQGLIHPESAIITANVVTDSSTASPSEPDICLADVNNPYPPLCGGSYEDNNAVPGYQQSLGIDGSAIGGEGELVEIRVTYLWRVLFPIFRTKFGTNGVLTISSSTVVKNEPL